MPTVDFMNDLTKGINSRMGAVSADVGKHVVDNSFVESARLKNIQAAQEQTDGLVEGVVNLGKKGFADLSSAVGDLAASGLSNQAAKIESLPEEVTAAYNVIQDPNADELQKAAAQEVLNQKEVITKPNKTGYGYTQEEGDSYGDIIANSIKASKDAKARKDWFDKPQDWVKTGSMDILDIEMEAPAQRLSEAWDKDDWGGILGASFELAEKAVTNPQAILEHAVGSLGSALTLGTDSPAYAMNIFNEAVAEYQKENGGKLPSKAEMKEMRLWSASAGAADFIGDKLVIGKFTKAGKTSAKRIAANVVGGAVAEAGTEGYQTAVEENLSKLEDVDVAKVAKAATIGAASSKALDVVSSPVQTAKSAKEVVKKVTAPITKKVAETRDKVTARKAAVQEGDIAKYTDTTSKDYDVVRSVETLRDRNVVADVTPEEKATNIATAKEQLQTKNKEFADAFTELDELDTKLREAGDNASQEDIKRYKEVAANVDTLSKQTAKASEVIKSMEVDTFDAETSKEDLTKAVEGDTESARRTFGSFQQSPERFTPEEANQLAEADNQLTEEENQALRTYAKVTETINKAKSSEAVNKDIIDGGTDEAGRRMIGINEYRDMMLSGNTTSYNAGKAGLSSFAKRHAAKADAFEKAYETFQETGKAQTVKIGNRKTIRIDNRSPGLIAKVRNEAELIQSALTDLESLTTPVQEEVTETTEPVQEEVVETPETTVNADIENVSSTQEEQFEEEYEPETTTPTSINTSDVGELFGEENLDVELTDEPTPEPRQEVREEVREETNVRTGHREGDVFTDEGLGPTLYGVLESNLIHSESNLEEDTPELQLHEAMDLLAKEEEWDDYSRFLAARIRDVSKLYNIPVKAIRNIKDVTGENYRGYFTYKKGDIEGGYIGLDLETMDSQTLLHEAVHAVTVFTLNKPHEEMTTTERELVANLRSVRRAFLATAPESSEEKFWQDYAATNLKEFTALAMTNPEVQAILKRVPYEKTYPDETDGPHMFAKFVKAVQKFLGIPPKYSNAFERTIDLTFQTMEAQRQEYISRNKPVEPVTPAYTGNHGEISLANTLVDRNDPTNIVSTSFIYYVMIQ